VRSSTATRSSSSLSRSSSSTWLSTWPVPRHQAAAAAGLAATVQLGVPAAVVSLGLQEKVISAGTGAAIMALGLASPSD